MNSAPSPQSIARAGVLTPDGARLAKNRHMKSNRDTRSIRNRDVTVVSSPEDRTKCLCVGCGGTFKPTSMERHHVVPYSVGGRTARWNVLLICARCHAVIDFDQPVHARVNHYMASRYGLLYGIRHPIVRELLLAEGTKPLSFWRETHAGMKRTNGAIYELMLSP